jgi:hypothetical protein
MTAHLTRCTLLAEKPEPQAASRISCQASIASRAGRAIHASCAQVLFTFARIRTSVTAPKRQHTPCRLNRSSTTILEHAPSRRSDERSELPVLNVSFFLNAKSSHISASSFEKLPANHEKSSRKDFPHAVRRCLTTLSHLKYVADCAPPSGLEVPVVAA